MRSIHFSIILFAASLAACTIAPTDRSYAISMALVGEWVYEHGDEKCEATAYEAYRSDGTYTSTDDSCDLISDGFGLFHYGWYVANNHVCFVSIEEQYADREKRPAVYREKFMELVKQGYVEDRCPWRVQAMTRRTITIQLRGEDRKPIVMKRQRWMQQPVGGS